MENDIRVLERDGRLIGYADVDGTREELPTWWCDVKVAPDVDADDVVSTLVAWLDERAQKGRLRVWTSESDSRITDAFRRPRLRASRHSYRMEIDLTGEPRRPAWPDGIDVRPVREDEHQLVYDTVARGVAGHVRPDGRTFDEWAHWLIRTESFDPSLWFLAFAGDELAGFSLCKQSSIDPNAGYVSTLGVRRPWRKQGLGEALLLHSFAAFRDRGWGRGTLGVDASSPTGATRLYERAGMRVYRDTAFFERPVRT